MRVKAVVDTDPDAKPDDPEWTSEGPIEPSSNKRRRQSRKGKPKKPESGGRMIVDRWTQAIPPPGSGENPNVPGI